MDEDVIDEFSVLEVLTKKSRREEIAAGLWLAVEKELGKDQKKLIFLGAVLQRVCKDSVGVDILCLKLGKEISVLRVSEIIKPYIPLEEGSRPVLIMHAATTTSLMVVQDQSGHGPPIRSTSPMPALLMLRKFNIECLLFLSISVTGRGRCILVWGQRLLLIWLTIACLCDVCSCSHNILYVLCMHITCVCVYAVYLREWYMVELSICIVLSLGFVCHDAASVTMDAVYTTCTLHMWKPLSIELLEVMVELLWAAALKCALSLPSTSHTICIGNIVSSCQSLHRDRYCDL